MSLSLDQLTEYVDNQCMNLFPDKNPLNNLSALIESSLTRLEFCFINIEKKYYNNDNNLVFNHLNSDHYSMFLYLLSNTAYKNNNINIAEKIFYLNKSLNGIDIFYTVELPSIFLFVHPVGTVIGNATFSDYIIFYQNVTIGSDQNSAYPSFGTGVIIYSGCSIIGDCTIDSNVIFSANTFIRNNNIESNSIVVGQYPDNKKKVLNKSVISNFFKGDNHE